MAVDVRVARLGHRPRRRGNRRAEAGHLGGGQPTRRGVAAQGPRAPGDDAGRDRRHGVGRPRRADVVAAAAHAAARAGARARLWSRRLLWLDAQAAARQLPRAVPTLLLPQPVAFAVRPADGAISVRRGRAAHLRRRPRAAHHPRHADQNEQLVREGVQQLERHRRVVGRHKRVSQHAAPAAGV